MKPSPAKHRIGAVVLLAGVLPALLGVAAHRLFGVVPHVHDSLHEFLELAGACIALGVAMLLWLRQRHERSSSHLLWVATALVAMGLVDAIHAVEGITPRAWLRGGATLLGGVFFACVWLPFPPLMARRRRSFILLVMTLALALGFWWKSDWMPLHTNPQGNYILSFAAVNVGGGLGFLAAALFFCRLYLRRAQAEDLVFAGHTMLFGVAALLFGFSHTWAVDWWFWHVARLLAYAVVLIAAYEIIVDLYQKSVRHAQELESRVEARTAELRRNEALLQAVLDNSPDAIFLKDRDSRLLLANPATFAIIGKPAEACIGMTDAEFYDDVATGRVIMENDRRILNSGKTEVIEESLSDSAGTRVYLSTKAPFRDAEGRVVGLIGVAHEITDRKRAEEALRQDVARRKVAKAVEAERKRFYDVLETLPVMICLLTPDYHVAFANRGFREKFGEANGRHCYEYCFGRSEPCEFCETYDVLKTGKPHHWEVAGPDGSVIDVHDFPFTDVDGTPMILEMDLDITAFRKAQAALKEANETLEQRVAERTVELQAANASLTDSRCAALNLMEGAVATRQAAEKASAELRKEIAERKRVEAESESLARFPRENPNPVLRAARDGTLVYANAAAAPLLQTWNCRTAQLLPAELAECVRIAANAAKPQEREVTAQGRIYSLMFSPAAATDDVNIYGRDITEHQRAEEALRQSREDLDRAQEVGQIGWWRLDTRRNVLTWSDENHRIFGVPKGTALTYETFLGIVHPDDRTHVDTQWKAGLRGEPYDIEHRLLVDGRVKWVREKAYLEFDETGGLLGGFGITQDISERKWAEEALRTSEARERQRAAELQTILDTAPIGMAIALDPHGKHIRGNPALERAVGVAPGGELSKATEPDRPAASFRAFANGRELTVEELPVQRAVRGEIVSGQLLEVLRTDGRTVRLHSHAAPLFDEQGRPRGAVAAFLDVTELIEAQETLRVTAAELARSNEELEQFAYIASHDLQEPLRMVSSYMRLLERNYGSHLDAQAREYIGFAMDGAARMAGLINDLLAYSHVGTRGREFEPTDCNEILQDVLAVLDLSIEDSGATVTHDDLPTVPGDGTQLAQVFQNLIGNALKFRGGEPPRIHVGAQRADGLWEFSIHDNGIGMEPRHFERVFKMFQRLHAREEYAGTGIGLAICKKIVERHGGRIWVESEPGKGSTFRFTVRA